MQYTNNTITKSWRELCVHFNASLPRNHPENWPDGPWELVPPEPAILTPEQLLAHKQSEIRSAAAESYSEPVTDAAGLIWRGGEASAAKIKNGVDMVEYAGLTTIDLRDANRDAHTMSLSEARAVAAVIGMTYQVKFQAEEQALLDLSRIDLTAADAAEQLNAIVFSDYLPAGPEVG